LNPITRSAGKVRLLEAQLESTQDQGRKERINSLIQREARRTPGGSFHRNSQVTVDGRHGSMVVDKTAEPVNAGAV